MARLNQAAYAALLMALTHAASSCGGGDEPTVTPGSIQVTVSPALLSVQQGANATVGITLIRGGGFTGPVTLSASGLPPGVTASLDPSVLAGGTTTASVITTVAAAVAPGTYTVTITATGTGVAQATATCQLTVTPAPNYALSSNPAAMVIRAGSTEVTTVNITRTDFPGDIGLGLQSPTPGIFGTFNPTPTLGNVSLLAVTVSSSVAPGSYLLTVVTNAPPMNNTLGVPVTVTPAPDHTKDVEYQFCDPASAPLFFAFQNGTGAWQTVTPVVTAGVTRYGFNLSQGRGGVIWVSRSSLARIGARRSNAAGPRRMLRSRARASGVAAAMTAPAVDAYETNVLYATTSELTQDGFQNCAETQPTKTVTATVLGVQSSQYGMVSLGDSHALFVGGTSTNPIMLHDVPFGPVDLIATRLLQPGQAPNRAIVVRGIDVPDGASLPSPIDFDAATLVPATATATITGAGGDNLEIFTDVVTASGRAQFTYDLTHNPTTSRSWSGLPPSAMVSSDFHGLAVFATPASGLSDDFRVALRFVGPVSNQTLALGPPGSPPTASLVASGAYPRFRFQGSIPQEYDKGFGISLEGSEEASNTYDLVVTSAFLTAAGGNALTYDVTMPDVAGLTAFPSASRLTAGENGLGIDLYGYTGIGIRDLRPAVGTEFKAAIRYIGVAVP